MKSSIRLKMVISLSILLLSSIFVCWFLNKQFLSDYYVDYKLDLMGEMFSQVDKTYKDYIQAVNNQNEYNDNRYNQSNETVLTSEDVTFLKAMRKLEGNNNVSIYVFKPMIALPLSLMYMKPYYPTNIQDEQQSILGIKLNEYYSKSYGTDVLATSVNYRIQKAYDDRMQTNYIELFGTTDNKSYIYIRSNFEGISESVAISNQFLAYVGIFVTLIGSAIMFVYSRSFTKPIYQLSNIARSMSNLDFSVKYESNRKDEIGILGKSINLMSNQLESTISELKSANNELQKDIQNKIEIEEMRKEFLSNVTHELKTPIALIQGYAEGLKENITDDVESRNFYCEVIMDEAAKMNTMVKKLLTLNQIESSASLIQFEHFDLMQVIASVIASTDILLQQKEIKISVDAPKELYVWADEYMLEEVITNYVSNAIHHVKAPNEIRIWLEVEQEIARVHVYNSGDWIPNEDLPNIWTKFYKVDKARTREYGGNGIGLSIVKAIIESHNQSFGVANVAGGVDFWFTCDIQSR